MNPMRRQLMRPSATATPLAVAAAHLSASYSIHGQLTNEVQNGVSLARSYDSLNRPTGYSLCASAPLRLNYTYDTLGRFSGVGFNAETQRSRASNAEVVVTYAYDHRGRMVTKTLCASAPLRLIKTTTYIWDNWNIIREIQWPVTSGQWLVVTDNVWGLDLDGTMQGAGGVGGLLAVIRDDGVFFPTYDANGNISEYVSTNGTIVAHYDYSPFGEPLVASGELAATFTHQFSTKPYCAVTGFSEYQMRKYRPGIGRWLSRDPIEEEGGFHLYLFCSNNQVHNHDAIGLWSGIDDLVFTVSGAVIGATSRIISDIVMGNDLSWQGIVGSAIGGAVAGELLLYAPGASIYLLAGIGATSGKSINVIHKRSSLIIIK